MRVSFVGLAVVLLSFSPRQGAAQLEIAPALGGSVDIRFELEDYVLWAQFDRGLPSATPRRLHHDILWSVGLSVAVFSR